MAIAYPRVWTLGRKAGNTIVVGCAAGRKPDLDRVAARAAADPSPPRLSPPEQIARVVASTAPLRDAS
jgi:hypothetical protein